MLTQQNTKSKQAQDSQKGKQQLQTKMQQLKANHNIKLKALRSHRSTQLLAVLCCLQLAGQNKPYFPQYIVHKITKSVFSAKLLESMSRPSAAYA